MRGFNFGKHVAVYWRSEEATGNAKGQWHDARVESSNHRKGTMTVVYDDGGSRDEVKINDEDIYRTSCGWRMRVTMRC